MPSTASSPVWPISGPGLEVLDPLADKLMLTTGFITLSVMHLVPLWLTILVASRDLMLMLGAAVAHFTQTQVDISPTVLGKVTTLIQLATLIAVVFCIAAIRSRRTRSAHLPDGRGHTHVRVALSLQRVLPHYLQPSLTEPTMSAKGSPASAAAPP